MVGGGFSVLHLRAAASCAEHPKAVSTELLRGISSWQFQGRETDASELNRLCCFSCWPVRSGNSLSNILLLLGVKMWSLKSNTEWNKTSHLLPGIYWISIFSLLVINYLVHCTGKGIQVRTHEGVWVTHIKTPSQLLDRPCPAGDRPFTAPVSWPTPEKFRFERI